MLLGAAYSKSKKEKTQLSDIQVVLAPFIKNYSSIRGLQPTNTCALQ